MVFSKNGYHLYTYNRHGIQYFLFQKKTYSQQKQVCLWWWFQETFHSHDFHMMFSHLGLDIFHSCLNVFPCCQSVDSCVWKNSPLVYMRSPAATSKHILYEALIKVYWPVCGFLFLFINLVFLRDCFPFYALLLPSWTIWLFISFPCQIGLTWTTSWCWVGEFSSIQAHHWMRNSG